MKKLLLAYLVPICILLVTALACNGSGNGSGASTYETEDEQPQVADPAEPAESPDLAIGAKILLAATPPTVNLDVLADLAQAGLPTATQWSPTDDLKAGGKPDAIGLVSFTLDNQSQESICEFYIWRTDLSPEFNILPQPLTPGGTYSTENLGFFAGDGSYNLAVASCNGRWVQRRNEFLGGGLEPRWVIYRFETN